MLRNIFTVAYYDQLRSLRARETYLIGLLMPALMMLLLGSLTGGDGVTVYVDVLNEDGSPLSAEFIDVLRAEAIAGTDEGDDPAFKLCVYDAGGANQPDGCGLTNELAARPDRWRDIAVQRLEDTDTFGAIIVPDGFGAALRAGESVEVIFQNSQDLSAPTLIQQKITAAISRMGGTVAVTNLVLDVAQDAFGGLEPGSEPRAAAFDTVRAQVETGWAERPARITETPSRAGAQTNGFNQSGPGMATMFVLIFMLNGATLLVYERETGTLQRLMALPVRRVSILAGKLLGRYVYGLQMFLVLMVIGALMGVEWGLDTGGRSLGIVLIVLSFTLAATALGLALATLVRTSDQAQSVALLMGLTLAPLGGAWWPLELVPDFMRTVGHISPIAWAMDGFQEIMWYDGTLVDVLPPVGVLLLMTAAALAFGVWRFRYE